MATFIMQPRKKATRWRRVPTAGVTGGSSDRIGLSHLRRELDQLPQLRADPRDPAQRARAQPIQLEELRPAQRPRQDLSPLSAGEHVLQHELDPARPGMLLLHRHAAAHDQLADPHARRADGVARAAVQAVVEVRLDAAR